MIEQQPLKEIVLFNPKVIALEIVLVTKRTTKKGTTKKLQNPFMKINCCIEVTEPLISGFLYQDEHHQMWYAGRATDVIQIRNTVSEFHGYFKMPTRLIQFANVFTEGSAGV